MLIAVIRVVATILACVGVWHWWRRMPQQHAIRTIVGVGLAARAAAGVAFFWVLYLRLPIAPSLQLGDGFWFFGLDGKYYFEPGVEAARTGIQGIMHVSPKLPSVFFVKTLGLLALVFGPTASVALLLNLVCHLGLSTLLVMFSRRVQTGSRPLIFALLAVSLSPSWILWSLQPMKEAFFMALLAAFFYALCVWIDVVVTTERSWPRAGLTAAALLLLIYAVAGIRWYFALILLGSTAIVLAAVVVSSSPRRLGPALACGLLLFALTQCIPAGAGLDLPPWAQVALRPTAPLVQSKSKAWSPLASMPSATAAELDKTHPGETDIRIVRTHAPWSSDQGGAGEAVRPESAGERIVAGSLVMLLPRWVVGRFNWIVMRGGRGLWLFADLDTLLFDAVLCGALLLAWQQFRNGGWPHPIFLHVAITLLLLSGPLVYTAVNFGTLLRQRGMIYLCLVMLPLTIGRATLPRTVLKPVVPRRGAEVGVPK